VEHDAQPELPLLRAPGVELTQPLVERRNRVNDVAPVPRVQKVEPAVTGVPVTMAQGI
jgi:hypothetical protein